MSEQQATTTAAPMSAEAASTERAQLMADAGWRAQAMDPSSQAWQRLSELNGAIAAEHDKQLAAEAQGLPQSAADPMPDPEIPAGAFDPPARPEGYDLPTHHAKELGLNVDPEADIALRQGLHAAGVDNWLAAALYAAAAHAVTTDMTPASVQSDYLNAEMELRQRWGGETEKRVALANEEGRRVFEKLPTAVTNGMSYREFMLVTGLANSRVAVEQLYLRAKARQH